MFLAIDIGNTTTSLAVIDGKRILRIFVVETANFPKTFKKDFWLVLKQLTRRYPHIRSALICSVVPKNLSVILKILKETLKISSLVIGKNIAVPIKNNYKNPQQVGQDRLVGAYAAKELYGYPSIIVDFGTAITVDFISSQGTYEGGIIVPGIRLSLESLFKKTALLPEIKTIKPPQCLIGKETKESILSGIFYGYGALCDGLINRIAQAIKGKPQIILTGGYTHLMKKFMTAPIDQIDKNLVFKGMILLDARNMAQGEFKESLQKKS